MSTVGEMKPGIGFLKNHDDLGVDLTISKGAETVDSTLGGRTLVDQTGVTDLNIGVDYANRFIKKINDTTIQDSLGNIYKII